MKSRWLRLPVARRKTRAAEVAGGIVTVRAVAAVLDVVGAPGAVEAAATGSEKRAFAWAHLGNIDRR